MYSGTGWIEHLSKFHIPMLILNSPIAQKKPDVVSISMQFPSKSANIYLCKYSTRPLYQHRMTHKYHFHVNALSNLPSITIPNVHEYADGYSKYLYQLQHKHCIHIDTFPNF